MDKVKQDKKDIRLLRDVLSEMKDSISKIPNLSGNENLNSLIEESIGIEKQDRKLIRGIFYFVLIVISLFIASIFYIIILENQTDNLKSDQIEKRNIINRLQWSDSMLNVYMKMSVDSINGTRSFISRSRDGKPLSYTDLLNENDSLHNLNSDLKKGISSYETKLELARDVYGIYYKITKKTKGKETIITTSIFSSRIDSLLEQPE